MAEAQANTAEEMPANPRSLLFVPGDRPERMRKAVASGADAVILDLEDSVAPERKPFARGAITDFLAEHTCSDVDLIVRINPLDTMDCGRDLDRLRGCTPGALMLPKAEGARSVIDLVERLEVPVPVLPIAAETPGAIFSLGSFATVSRHLSGLTWGAEDLAAAIGAISSRTSDGQFLPPLDTARNLVLFAAFAAGVAAIETVYADVKNTSGLAAGAARAAAEGFSGMMAIHPLQVPIINAAFTPAGKQVEDAMEILNLFAANPGAGVLAHNGKMLDRPHLLRAQAILARSRRS